MAKNTFNDIKVTGLACAVPSKVERITDFADKFDVDKFIETTGVKERRRVAHKQSAGDLCYEAAERLIAHKGYDKNSFDGIMLITQTPDYNIPATAHILHYRLGLSKDCMVFDVNLGCSGFVYGVNIVASMIQAGSLSRVLICFGEANHWEVPKDDPATSMLFGDAGSAVILEKESGGVWDGEDPYTSESGWLRLSGDYHAGDLCPRGTGS